MDQQQQGFSHSRISPDAKSLYVGNLNTKVNDALLWEVFTTAGAVESCKIIKDKFGESAGYGFVDFYAHDAAEKALQNINGKTIYDKEIKVNWAAHSTGKEETSNSSNHFNIFVGDLSPDINDESLYKAFQAFGSISDARVMWDQTTGRSRGYGFVAFREKPDAERAMTEMNGVWLGNRAIRCNWANQKVNSGNDNASSSPSASRGSTPNYSEVATQSTSTNTTVYVGNLPTSITESALGTTFQKFGSIAEVRVQKGKGYAFVKFHTHEQAARAIVAANETTIEGHPIRCSWGKERTNAPATANAVPAANQVYGYYPGQYAQPYPMYNAMPYYGQQYYPQAGYQADPSNYYAQGYDPYAYAGYAGYQQHPQQVQQHPQQHPQHPQQQHPQQHPQHPQQHLQQAPQHHQYPQQPR
eukprot:CAMPEP_0117059360 /NCGR_PEP_ID=MMETSP0472-20121206/41228_1 /TAXON_ID=693140 ORGANISM="Tiarina fusus, Strain LIS" /NCGR_SAMPLE_ID=MMETSP0472 /ASSEMBLY_ACC=CAM_ASM_000603 /LENGTH=413 /DNA_ID=CAMNT_0004777027 /DNA_START=84 /DNA_END=1325 /DNA_ORIENTATION=+